ncbi:MAG: tetratricopeptide repeat protein [Gammaproteobacteria bacterium]|nr:tetratricopeptide repeat protein [Gammaproteobacteria bacterium]
MNMKLRMAFLGALCCALIVPVWAQNGCSGGYQECLQLAKQGDADAQFDLGVMYNEGSKVPRNHAQAARWFRKAAEQGHADAQAGLGWLYGMGRGVPQDYVEAYKWFSLGAAQGNESARSGIALMKHVLSLKRRSE